MIDDVDTYWMQEALILAKQAAALGEVPVGAILVLNGQKIAEGWNQPILASDPTAHAEIAALRAAGQHQNNYRLINSTLYVTLEPCLMCAGAMVHARIQRLVFGAFDPKAGAVSSVFRALENPALNHRVSCVGGVLAEASSQLLQEFFRARR